MAVQVRLVAAEITNTGIQLELVTSETTYPGETVRFVRTFADTDTLASIQNTVTTLCQKYWQIRAAV